VGFIIELPCHRGSHLWARPSSSLRMLGFQGVVLLRNLALASASPNSKQPGIST
jgi:hypothetical protein